MSIKVGLTSNSKITLYTYFEYVKFVSRKLNIKLISSVQPIKIKKLTLLKSPHVYKKAKESFEIRTYKMILIFESEKNYETIDIKKLWSIILNKPNSLQLSIKSYKAKK